MIRKETHNTSKTYVIMDNIFRLVSVLSVTEQDIREAFEQKWKDFGECAEMCKRYHERNARGIYI